MDIIRGLKCVHSCHKHHVILRMAPPSLEIYIYIYTLSLFHSVFALLINSKPWRYASPYDISKWPAVGFLCVPYFEKKTFPWVLLRDPQSFNWICTVKKGFKPWTVWHPTISLLAPIIIPSQHSQIPSGLCLIRLRTSGNPPICWSVRRLPLPNTLLAEASRVLI